MRFSGLSIRQLEAFEAFMETRSVSGAAGLLNISQPSVSRLLQDLEADCRLHLFARRQNRLIPTHQALLFADEVSRTFRTSRNLMKIAQEISELKRGTLKIGTLAALSFKLIPDALGALRRDAENLSAVVSVRHSKDIAAAVATGLLDVGIIDEGVPAQGMQVSSVQEVNSVCVLDGGHPLASRETISLADLADWPFVSLDPDYYAREPDGIQLNAAVRGRVTAEAFQSFVACSFVKGSDALSIVDPFTARFYAPLGLQHRPISFRVPFRIAVVQNELSATNSAANRFLEILVRRFSEPERTTVEQRATDLSPGLADRNPHVSGTKAEAN